MHGIEFYKNYDLDTLTIIIVRKYLGTERVRVMVELPLRIFFTHPTSPLPTYNLRPRNTHESRYNTFFFQLNLTMRAKFTKSRTWSPFILTQNHRSRVSQNSLGPHTTLPGHTPLAGRALASLSPANSFSLVLPDLV